MSAVEFANTTCDARVRQGAWAGAGAFCLVVIVELAIGMVVRTSWHALLFPGLPLALAGGVVGALWWPLRRWAAVLLGAAVAGLLAIALLAYAVSQI